MYHIVIQNTVAKNKIPAVKHLKQWAKTVLKAKIPAAEVTIRIVDPQEMTDLNAQYRKKNKTTNVLSFPFDMPADITDELPILGDIVICAEVVNQEAKTQGKTPDAHWAHMVIHGMLHLLGYDHETMADARIMEPKEIALLKSLGFPNPYSEGK